MLGKEERAVYILTMAFLVKQVVGGQLKNLTGGLTEEKPEGEKSDAAAKGMTQEEFEQYQQQLEEEKYAQLPGFSSENREFDYISAMFRLRRTLGRKSARIFPAWLDFARAAAHFAQGVGSCSVRY